ncbi:MAG: c-type cytochrome [Pseudomonadota bacterium]
MKPPILPSARRLALLLLLCCAGPSGAGTHTRGAGAVQPALLYHNYCSVCHGDKGDGKSRAQFSLHPAPRDFTLADPAALPRARMVDAVLNGRPGTAMTAWKSELSQLEAEAVVDYVRATFMPGAQNLAAGRGAQVYRKTCAVCHGDNGDGKSRAQASLTPPPRDFTSAAARAELDEQRMLASVTYGRADTAMAGFKSQLSADDIGAVVGFIRASFMASDAISGIQHGRRGRAPDGAPVLPPVAPAPAALAVRMDAPMPERLKGNPVPGAAFYMANCATCHGTAGDGRGPRAYFINPKPRNFLHTAARAQLNRAVLYEAVSNGRLGTEMPAWSKVLTPQQVADVSEFVFQRFIAPPAVAGKR